MLFVSHKIWNIDKNISNLWYTFPTFDTNSSDRILQQYSRLRHFPYF
jgi:hypothetical protein